MKIYVKAKPRSKKEYVKKVDATHYIVAVNEAPDLGKANKALIKSLARYFDKPPSHLCIVSGETARQKVVEVQCLKE